MREGNCLRLNLFVLCLVFLPSCWQSEEQKKTGLVVVNVLSQELYDDCHIKGSICVPFDQVVDYMQQKVDKEAQVVLYCSNYMCAASGHACKKLVSAGFAHVYAYEAGMAEWYQQGLPVEGACRANYLDHVIPSPASENGERMSVISTSELAEKMELK